MATYKGPSMCCNSQWWGEKNENVYSRFANMYLVTFFFFEFMFQRLKIISIDGP